AQTDENGEYRIDNIPAGKYYVEARCFQAIPMPHAFIRRDAMAVVPTLTYAPLFYPASTDLSGATRVSLAPGTELSGIDFRMAPAIGVPLRGRVQPVSPDSNILLTLLPQDPLLRRSQQGARVNPTNGEFRIANVRPGSYELVARTISGPSYTARVPVLVGATAPEPVEVMLITVPQVNGSVTIDGDGNAPPLKNLRVVLNPVDTQPTGPSPQAALQDDGTFALAVPPGRWRLRVLAGPAYIKSVSIGDQQASASALDIGSTPSPLKIVLGTRPAQV